MNEYWQTKWKTKDIAWDQQQPNPLLLTYFKNMQLQPGARIFVPLSGKSIDMVWLAKQGYQIMGVELSLEACQLFFSENNIPYQQSNKGKFDVLTSEKITLLSGDFFDLDKAILGQVDAIYDRAALIALPMEIRQQYVKKMVSFTAFHTQVLLLTSSYNQNEMQGPPFSVTEEEVDELFGKSFNVVTLYKENALIPEHLRAKGLTHAQECVFYLSAKKIRLF